MDVPTFSVGFTLAAYGVDRAKLEAITAHVGPHKEDLELPNTDSPRAVQKG
jgi:hypothetical protein